MSESTISPAVRRELIKLIEREFVPSANISQFGECTSTDLSLSCPLEVAAGLPFVVSATVKNYAAAEQPIYTYVYATGDRSGKTWKLIDLYQYFPEGTEVTYTSSRVTMPDEPLTVHAYNYIWYQGQWVWECHKTKSINALPAEEAVYAWLTIAEGDSLQELETNCAGKELQGQFRIVIETTGCPSWMLKTTKWFIDACLLPLRAVGVQLMNVRIKGTTFYVYMHASPHPAAPVVAAIIAGLVLVGFMTWMITKAVIQVAQTLSDYYAYKEAHEERDLILYLTEHGWDPAAIQAILDSWRNGVEPEVEERWWEKYVKWALIGGGVIIGTAVLVPVVQKVVTKSK